MPEANFGKVLVLLRKGYYLIFEQLLSNEATVTSQWNFHNLFGFCSLEAFDYVGNYKIFKNITTICP